MNSPLLPQENYQGLLQGIGQLLQTARQQAAQAVNTLLVQTYWHIGQYIVEYEQGGNEKAEYGSGLLDRLSKDLSALHGKGFSRSNIYYMRKLYLTFQNSETLSHKLTWSHYFEILKADEPLEISFYTSAVGWTDARKPNISKRQMLGFAHLPRPTCYSLSAGQYFDVQIEYIEITESAFKAKMKSFSDNLDNFFEISKELEVGIKDRLERLQYDQNDRS